MTREFARFGWVRRRWGAALGIVPLFWGMSLIGHGLGECRPDDAGCRLGEPSALLGELALGLLFGLMLGLAFGSAWRGLVALVEPRLGSRWRVPALIAGMTAIAAAAWFGAYVIFVRVIV